MNWPLRADPEGLSFGR